MDAQWRNRLLVCGASGGGNPVVPEVTITVKPQQPIRPDLLELFDLAEVEKYYTEEELAGHPGRKS
jgi:succinate dehydrogenase / fumarate reductase flavoprotein subunit